MVKPEIRDMNRSFIAGIFGFAFMGLVVFVAFKAQGGLTSLPLVPQTTVRAEFDNTAPLQSNDLVRQGSIRIGAVQSVEYRDHKSLVTMRLDNSHYDIYRNATAEVWELNALGSKFIELTPGTPDAGPLGDTVIPVSQTKSAYDLGQVLNIFDDKTRLAATNTLQQVGGGMVEQATNFHDFLNKSDQLLPDLGTVSSALASQQADLPALLASGDRLTGHLTDRTKEIASLIAQTNSTFEALDVDGSRPLDATLRQAPGTLASAKQALDALDRPLGDTEVTMREFRPGAQSLADSEKDLRGVLREGIDPLDKVPDVSHKAKPAFSALKDTFSDARPLAPDVAKAFEYAGTPLRILKPYAPEAGEWFRRFASFVSMGSTSGERYAYINVNPSLGTLTSAAGPACVSQDNYPRPGEADGERTPLGAPSGTPCLTGSKMPPSLSAAWKHIPGLLGGNK